MEMRSQINQSAPHGKYGGLFTSNCEVQTLPAAAKGRTSDPRALPRSSKALLSEFTRCRRYRKPLSPLPPTRVAHLQIRSSPDISTTGVIATVARLGGSGLVWRSLVHG